MPRAGASIPTAAPQPGFGILADEARDIVLLIRRDGRILEANQAAVAAYGYTREELLALSVTDLRATETLPLAAAQMAQADTQGILFETVHRRKDGRSFPVEVSARGTVVRGERVLLSIARDITDRQFATATLSKRARQLEAIRAITAEVAQELDLTRLLELIVQRATDLVEAGQGLIRLWDEGEQALVPKAWTGAGKGRAVTRLRLGEGVAGTVAQRREGMIVNDFPTSPYALPSITAVSSHARVLAEPLLARDRLVGVITIDRHADTGPFQGEDREVIALFARHAAIAIENARLYEATQRRTTELEALLSASKAIESSLDLDPVLQAIVDQAAAISATPTVRLFLLEEEAQVLRCRVAVGFPLEAEPDLAIRVGASFSGQVAATGEALAVADTRVDSRTFYLTHVAKYCVVSYLGLPVKFQTRLLGVLVFNTPAPRHYTPAEIAFLSAFAQQAAVAIQNARLYDAAVRELTERRRTEQTLRDRTLQLEAVRAVTAEITRELNLPTLLDLILHRVAELAGATNATLFLWDATAQVLVPRAWTGTREWLRTERLRLGQRVAGTVAERRRGMVVNDFRSSPYGDAEVLARTTHTAVLGEPLLYGDRLVGVITVNNEETGKRFSEQDREVVALFASQAAVAIENAQSHQAAVRRGKELEALLRATRSLMSGLNLEMILDRLLAEAAATAGTSHVRVILVDRAANVLRVVRVMGGLVPNGYEYPLASGLSGVVIATGEPLFSPDVGVDARSYFGSRYRALGMQTYLGLPIKRGHEVLGVLVFNTTAPHEYKPEEVAYLASFADQAALAIVNARLYEAAQQELEERRQAEAALATRTQHLEAVRVVSEEITHELDLAALLRLIYDRAVTLVRGESGLIFLWDEAAQHLVPHCWVGFGDWVTDLRLGPGDGVAGAVAASRQGVIANDVRNSPYALPAFLDRSPHVSVLGEPLLYGSRLVGVVTIGRNDPAQPFTGEDQRLLRLFATQAAIAIENARLFQEQQQAYRRLQQAQEELVRSSKLRALGQMGAGIAHDLNNTLAAVLGQAELLRLRVHDPAVLDGLRTLETAATDGAAVVSRLQDFGRQRGQLPLTPMKLDPLVQDALEMTRPRWRDEAQRQGRTIHIEADGLDRLPAVLGHAPEIREALTNIILNAVDAMPHGGSLRFAGRGAEDGAEWVELDVADSGIGIPEAIRQHIFDPFFTTKGVQGTGLGLSVVYAILERHGGRIDVASAPGHGTTFTLRFRAAPVAGQSGDNRRPQTALPPRRLLLIDDDPQVRQTVAALLRAAGHAVTEAESGRAGLQHVTAEALDAVLTDLGMPDLAGWDVARETKAIQPELPVILLTGWGEQAEPREGSDDRRYVDRILGKPVRLDDLLRAIGELCPPEGGSAPAAPAP